MKRLFILLFLFCLPAWASIAYVSASGTTHAYSTACSSACAATTLTAGTTGGNLVIVGLSWRTTTANLMQVKSNASTKFTIYSQGCNGTGTCSALTACIDCAASTTVTPVFSASTKSDLNVAEYSGVTWIGISPWASGTSTTPGCTITTGDSNDWLIAETASAGTTNPTSGTGNLRQTNNAGSSGVAAALIDNTVSSPGSVTATATISSGIYSASCLELRTTAAKTYIWPDCDGTHPCLIHHDGDHPSPSGQALTAPIHFFIQPSLASNTLVLTLMHPSTYTVSSISDDQSNSWSAGATTTDATNGLITEYRYVCGAATGTSHIQINYTATMGTNDQVYFSEDEFSGIATSSCSGGTSGTNTVVGKIQPGSITASGSQMLFTTAISANAGTEPTPSSGWSMPDDLSATVFNDPWANVISTVSVQDCTSGCNPSIYANGQAVSIRNNYSIIAQAFKASNGAGTQPSSGQSWVVRHVQYLGPGSGASARGSFTFPTTGNAVVVTSSNAQSIQSLSGLADNAGNSLTAVTMTDTTTDPQIYSVCLGSGGVNRDRALFWTANTTNGLQLAWYDISGAKTSGGAQGCVGTTRNHALCSSTNCAQTIGTCGNSPYTNSCRNIVNILGSDGGTFTATLNSTAKSVVLGASYLGAGPPVGACTTTSGGTLTGGLAPPTCTGNSSTLVSNSLWAAPMGDGSHLYNGDPYFYWYTSSTSGYSVDFMMANEQDAGGTGGTVYDGGAIEIMGQPASGVTMVQRRR